MIDQHVIVLQSEVLFMWRIVIQSHVQINHTLNVLELRNI